MRNSLIWWVHVAECATGRCHSYGKTGPDGRGGEKKALLGAAERTFARPLSFLKEKVVPLQQFKEI
ncbi:MAG: hypothetical protein PUF32_01430 [Prevotella sp.]|nr:hypothetical protein [Prevotella sp.]